MVADVFDKPELSRVQPIVRHETPPTAMHRILRSPGNGLGNSAAGALANIWPSVNGREGVIECTPAKQLPALNSR